MVGLSMQGFGILLYSYLSLFMINRKPMNLCDDNVCHLNLLVLSVGGVSLSIAFCHIVKVFSDSFIIYIMIMDLCSVRR